MYDQDQLVNANSFLTWTLEASLLIFRLQASSLYDSIFTIRAIVILFKDLLIRTLRPQAYSLCMTQAENFGIFQISILATVTV